MKKLTFAITLIITLAWGTFAFAQTPSTNLLLHGWAWSWTTGWIKLSSKQMDSAGYPTDVEEPGSSLYGVTFDATTGLGSGYAWSPNIGWISFNQADLIIGPSCQGPVSAAVPSRLVTDGTGYKLTGTARALSPMQSSFGWSNVTAHGNWNGCIYFDNASMPASSATTACPVSFAVRFPQIAGVPGSYLGQGHAWNAAGLVASPADCATPIGWGGLSFIDFAGSLFKAVLVRDSFEVEIAGTTSGWNGACRQSTPPYNTVSQTITVNYTVTPVAGTSCTWNLTGQPSQAVNLAQTSRTFTFTPTSSSTVLSMTCTNPDAETSPVTRTLGTFSCTECSDSIDNTDPEDTKADHADNACHSGCVLTGNYLPGTPSEQAGLNGNTNCAAGSKVKGIPIIKEN